MTDLVERVARAICERHLWAGAWEEEVEQNKERWAEQAEAAIAIVLEEAAKVADAHRGSAAKNRRNLLHGGQPLSIEVQCEERGEDIAAEIIAAAIRASGEKT